MPGLEDGYTRVSNEIFESISKAPLSGSQLRVIVVLWRYTYGFSRKDHALSESFIAKATGINIRQIKRVLTDLINYKIVTVKREATFNSSRVLEFNKYSDTWKLSERVVINTPGGENDSGGQFDTSPGGESDTSPGGQNVTQERKYLNKNIKKDYSAFFDSIWNLYPCKKGKGSVSLTQIKKLQKLGFETIRTCIERYIKDKPPQLAWKYGSTFFSSGYIDYLDENYEPPGGKTSNRFEGIET